jgi:hypothetical protein
MTPRGPSPDGTFSPAPAPWTSRPTVRILVTSLASDNSVGLATDFVNSNSYAWLIADFANAVTGFDAGDFTINDSNFQNSLDPQGAFNIVLGTSVTGGDNTQIYLTYSTIPEPGAALLGGLGVLLLLRRRR